MSNPAKPIEAPEDSSATPTGQTETPAPESPTEPSQTASPDTEAFWDKLRRNPIFRVHTDGDLSFILGGQPPKQPPSPPPAGSEPPEPPESPTTSP